MEEKVKADASGELFHVRGRVIALRSTGGLSFGGLAMEAIHTPGHTPGSTCFLLEDILFSGDTLFPGGPGATADPELFREVMDGLEKRLFTLPDETRVLPGHGLATTIGTERPSLPEWRRRGY